MNNGDEETFFGVAQLEPRSNSARAGAKPGGIEAPTNCPFIPGCFGGGLGKRVRVISHCRHQTGTSVKRIKEEDFSSSPGDGLKMRGEMGRPSWDEYFMEIAETVAKRSTCLRRKVGAIIVRDKRILATGYNGTLTGLPHCEQIGCIREEKNVPSGQMQELCRGLHAEQNGLLFAAANGVNIKKGTIYCTHQPCVLCAKMIIQSGIVRAVFKGEYPDKMAQELFKQAKVELCQIK